MEGMKSWAEEEALALCDGSNFAKEFGMNVGVVESDGPKWIEQLKNIWTKLHQMH